MKNPMWSIRKRLNYLKRFPQIGPRGNARFILDQEEGLDKKILAGVPFEERQIEFACQKILEMKISRLIDVGANFGLYTVLLGRIDSIIHVESFEPVRRTFNQLSGNVFSNKLDSKVKLHRIALGDFNGSFEINKSPNNSGLARLSLDGAKSSEIFTERETIQVCKGDEILELESESIYIKIDVEGYALGVLKGMDKILNSNKGVLQIECKSTERDIFDFLSNAGWKPILVMSDDAFFQKQ